LPHKTIYSTLKQSMKYIILTFLFIITYAAYSQEKTSGKITEQETKTLKKTEPQLWYVDSLPPYKYRKTKDSLGRLDSLRNAKKEQRERVFENLEIPAGLFEILKWVFYILLALGVGFLILKGNFSFNLSPKNKKIDIVITETSNIESVEQLGQISFQGQINEAENQGNYRLATRLYYLWTLKKLIDNQLINFHKRKTNQDYCHEMMGNKNSEEFNQSTNIYNHVWFGEFNINQEIYQKVKADFNQLLEKL
jgi:hypothetical protein